MNVNTGTILGVTFVLVALYLVVANSDGFDRAVKALSGAYIGGVTALQGRNAMAVV